MDVQGNYFQEYLEERFAGLTTLINARFENVDDKLEAVHEEAKRTNHRVTKLEEFEDETKQYMLSRVTDCPHLDEIHSLNNKHEGLLDSLRDINFFVRHPKLFIGMLVVIVLLTLATFLENNPFIHFIRDATVPPQTEQVK